MFLFHLSVFEEQQVGYSDDTPAREKHLLSIHVFMAYSPAVPDSSKQHNKNYVTTSALLSKSLLPTKHVGPTSNYCWAGVADVGPTLIGRWTNVSCLLGCHVEQLQPINLLPADHDNNISINPLPANHDLNLFFKSVLPAH